MLNAQNSQLTLDAIRRQAKHLARLFDIPLTSAKEALAKGPYQCARWSDLVARIKNRDTTPHMRSLALSASKPEAKAYFEQIVDDIIAAIADHINIEKDDPIRRREAVYKVFTNNDTSITLEQIFPNTPMPHWVSANVGLDPEAVLQATHVVDDKEFNLIAIRTFQSGAYPSDHEEFGLSTMPFVRNCMHIVWAKPELWDDAVQRFIEDEDDTVEFIQPTYNLNDTMTAITNWFSETLEHIYDHYLCFGENLDFLPLKLNGWSYLVFGFLTEDEYTATPKAPLTQPAEADTTLISLISGVPVCIQHPLSNKPNHWPSLPTDIRSTSSSCSSTDRHFIRPATTWDIVDIQQEIQRRPESPFQVKKDDVRWTLSTSDIPLAVELVSKVAAGDITYDKSGTPIVMLKAKPKESRNAGHLLLNLEVISDSYWSTASMIGSSYRGLDGDPDLYGHQVRPELFRLTQVLGKKRIMKAICSRLIGHEQVVADILA